MEERLNRFSLISNRRPPICLNSSLTHASNALRIQNFSNFSSDFAARPVTAEITLINRKLDRPINYTSRYANIESSDILRPFLPVNLLT